MRTNNLGVAFQQKADWEAAEACHRQTLQFNPAIWCRFS